MVQAVTAVHTATPETAMIEFYNWIQSGHNPFSDAFFVLLSFLGSAPVYIFILASIFWNLDKRFGFRLAVLFLFSMAVNSWLKEAFRFQRPIGEEGIRSIYTSSATGYAFPSGHSQGVATFYTYLWMKYPKFLWKILGIVMILGIGFSRLYLGVHWPGDVFMGWGLGFLIVWCFDHMDKRLFKLPFSLPLKLILSILLPLLALLLYHSKEGFQMSGFVLGFSSGYFLEDHFLDYQERTPLRHSLYKTAIGLGILLVYILLLQPLTNYWVGFYLPVYALAGLWTAIGAPYLFRHFGWEKVETPSTLSKRFT